MHSFITLDIAKMEKLNFTTNVSIMQQSNSLHLI